MKIQKGGCRAHEVQGCETHESGYELKKTENSFDEDDAKSVQLGENFTCIKISNTLQKHHQFHTKMTISVIY